MGKPLVSYTGPFRLTHDKINSLSSFISPVYICVNIFVCVEACADNWAVYVSHINCSIHAVIRF